MQNMLPFYFYFRLKGLSYYRMFREFPLLIQLLLLSVCFVVGYALLTNEMRLSTDHYLYSLGAFVLMGQWFCKPSPKEEVFIKSLKLPLAFIQLTHCMLLSIPFGLASVYLGLFVGGIGSVAILLLSRINRSSKRVCPSFYQSSAYQWLSVWRVEGMWFYLSGIFLTTMGTVSDNHRLVCFSLIWSICLPCFFSYYKRQDPIAFLTIYKSIPLLLKKKTIELLSNSLLSVSGCLVVLLLLSPSGFLSCIWVVGCGLFTNILLMYAYYICYPSIIQAIGLVVGIGIITIALLSDTAFGYWFASLLYLPVFYFIASQTLKSIRYAKLRD